VGHGAIVGATSHIVEEAMEAQRAGADYVSAGPVLQSTTQNNLRQVGQPIAACGGGREHPCCCIGGIEVADVPAVLALVQLHGRMRSDRGSSQVREKTLKFKAKIAESLRYR